MFHELRKRGTDGRVADSTGNWVDTLAPPLAAPLPAARARRPADRRVAVAAAMLVVGRDCGGRGRTSLPQPVACAAVLRRRLRDARCGLHLERHRRPRSRRQGRAHALAPDPVGTGEREGGGNLSRAAGAGRARWCCFSSTASRYWLGIASLGIVAVYPLAKRVTWWPQIVLGPCVLVGRADGLGRGVRPARCAGLLLYAGSIAWVIGYDTIYAHQDREDDALIGVKSTARLFGRRTRLALLVLLRARRGADRTVGRRGRCRAGVRHRLRLLRRASRLADRAARYRRSGLVPEAVQVEPRRRTDPVRGADRGCAIQIALFPRKWQRSQKWRSMCNSLAAKPSQPRWRSSAPAHPTQPPRPEKP